MLKSNKNPVSRIMSREINGKKMRELANALYVMRERERARDARLCENVSDVAYDYC